MKPGWALPEQEDIEQYDTLSGCHIIISTDSGKKHLSISHPSRLPTYDELKSARYKYLPDNMYVAQIFPPKREFVNLHPYVLHLYELSKKETPYGQTA